MSKVTRCVYCNLFGNLHEPLHSIVPVSAKCPIHGRAKNFRTFASETNNLPSIIGTEDSSPAQKPRAPTASPPVHETSSTRSSNSSGQAETQSTSESPKIPYQRTPHRLRHSHPYLRNKSHGYRPPSTPNHPTPVSAPAQPHPLPPKPATPVLTQLWLPSRTPSCEQSFSLQLLPPWQLHQHLRHLPQRP